MNRNRYRLVFSVLQGRYVPVCEGTRSRGKCASSLRGVALAAVVLGVAPAGFAAGPLPAITLPKPAAIFSPGDAATTKVVGSTMTVKQTAPKAILNWQQFNLSKDASVRFDQPSGSSVALNRIFDANPSVIQGRIDANGQIYLINGNGILFDRGAQINVGGLVASALDISDTTFKSGYQNIIDGSPAFAYGGDSLGFERSLVRVENGASIKTASGGQVFMFAKRVENAGRIETPQGQTLLAAGAKVYLAASEDPLLRGFLVEVDPFFKRDPLQDPSRKPFGFEGPPDTTVTNEKSAQGQGEIIADRGNVTLIGHAVNQQGRISATTSVNANGSVYLVARENTHTEPQQDFSLKRVADIAGTVTLGPGSVTEILPVAGSTETSIDSQGFNPSQVQVFGGKILMQSGSSIHAPAGKVDLIARVVADPKFAGTLPETTTQSRIVLASDSVIDVSGVENVELPMERNVVSAGLFGVELADSTVQRNGVLSRKTVKFDLRKGLPGIANVQGAVDGIGRTVGERSAVGGTVSISSDGALVTREGATIDVSGGSLRYLDGFVETTTLLAGGRPFDISTAPADRIYDGIATSRRFETGYIEGKSAGKVSLYARGMAVDGTLLGGTTVGPRQRSAPPAGGQLVFGNAAATGNLADFVVRNVELARGFGTVSPEFDRSPLTASLGGRATTTRLSTQPIDSGGFGSLAVYANGSITLPGTVDLNLAPNSSLSLTAHEVSVAGDVVSPGGAVTLTGRATIYKPEPGTAKVEVKPATRIDLSGMWVNDILDSAASGLVLTKGGSFVANAAGTTRLGEGSVIDVSGGAWLRGTPLKQTRSNGDAGSIRLQASSLAVNPLASVEAPEQNPLELKGELRGYALGEAKGGKLTVSTSKVGIGGPAADDTLGLAADFFASGGFADYTLVAPNGIDIAAGTRIAPRQTSWLLDGREWTRPSGSLRDFATLTLLPPELRQATNVTLTADNPFVGTIELGAGSAIDADIGASVKLVAGRQLTVAGRIGAPGGKIDLSIENAETGKPTEDTTNNTDLAGFLPDQTIWLKSTASLIASGASKLTLDANGDRQGEVFDGGRVSLRATKGYVVAEKNALIDVRGTAAEIDLRKNGPGGSVLSTPVTLYSDGGTISISAREGAFLDATLDAHSGGGSAAGGRFELALDRANVFDAQVVVGLHPYANVDRRIVVMEDGAAVPWNFKPGGEIPFSLFGMAPVSATRLKASGVDEIALTSDSQIVFSGNVKLTAPRAITLDAPVYAVASEPIFFLPGTFGGGSAAVAAPYVSFANRNSLARYQTEHSASGGKGSLSVVADLLDITGNVAIQNVGHTSFTGRSDIRLSAVLVSSGATTDLELNSSLHAAGQLDFTAGQIYPTSLSKYSISSVAWTDPDLAGSAVATSASSAGLARSGANETTGASGSLIRFARFGSAGDLPLSAAGKLEVTADRVEQGGVLRAPLGTIALNAADSLALLGGSETSVTAQGSLIPFGRTENGLNWVYDIASGRPVNIPAPPEKKILLTSHTVRIDAESTVDLRGGGDLYGYEFVAGLGGSRDVLASTGTYAVIPGYKPSFAPYDPQYSAGYGSLKPGDQVTLSGGAGLAAGTYTLLPAHYALLPGAFAVTPVSGYRDLLPGRGVVRNDGAQIVSGYSSIAGLGQRDARSQGYLVEPATTIRKRSEYRDEFANTFFVDNAERNDLVPPRLPRDGGRLQLDAQVSRDLVGKILMSAAKDANGALGGQLDIDAPDIFVSETSPATSGAMVIRPGMLTDLGAESILLGGLRGESVNGTQAIDVGADNVIVASSTSPLRAGEVLLVARDNVIVGARSVIEATPANASSASTVNKPATSYSLTGDSAVLRVARGEQGDLVRSGFARESGSILIGENARLKGDSVLVDATGDIAVSQSVKFDASAIGVAAGRIGFGAPPAGTDGLIVRQPLLTQLQGATDLSFKSYSDISFFGDVSLGRSGLASVTLDAPALIGVGIGTTTITAGRVTLKNSTGLNGQADLQAGEAELQIAAHSRTGDTQSGVLVLGKGDVVFSGFASTSLSADRTLSMAGEGSDSFSGGLKLAAASVGGETGSSHRIAATGAVEISRNGTAAVQASEGFAAQLEITGTRIAQRGTIDLPAGSLTLRATGDADGDGVVLESGSVTRTAGHTKIFHAGEQDETAVHADAGNISLVALPTTLGEADAGGHDVTIKSGARVDVSAASGGGNAGTLAVIAPAGKVAIAGEIAGGASSGGEGGSLSVDAGSIASLSAIVARAGSGRFTNSFDLRARNGDLTLAAGDTLRAGSVNLSADTGAINIAGRIDASGVKGGRINVFAGSDLTLQGTADGGKGARLDAYATGAGKDGGRIVLGSSAGTVDLAAGSTIRLSSGSKGSGGSLVVRATQNEAHDDVLVSHLDSTITGASEVAVEAVRVYEYAGNVSIGAGPSSATALGINQIGADADSFMTNREVIVARLGQPDLILRSGVEVRAAGDLSLDSPWNLGALRPGGQSGYLSLRAGGNLLLKQSLSDGFASEARSAEDPNGSGLILPSAMLDDTSWSYRLVGGADLNAADPLRVAPRPNAASGDVVLSAQTMVRTGTGSIQIAASRDVRLESDFPGTGESAVLYTAGRPSATLEHFIDYLSVDFGGAPGMSNYAHRGGSIDIAAQRDVIGAMTPYLPSNWMWRFGSSALDPTTGEYPFFGVPAWFPRPDLFRQNIGALAGGDVNVKAGRDVRDLSVMIPTTGRMNSTKPDATKLVVEGGGDLRLAAGRDIAGGQFLVSRGEARLTAGGVIGDGSSWTDSIGTAYTLAPLLLLGDATATLVGRQGATIENAIDPWVIPQSDYVETLGVNRMFSYSERSALSLSALTGNVELRNNVVALANVVKSAPFDAIGSDLSGDLKLSPHPGTVTAYAFSGDLTLPNGLKMFPTKSGNLELLAQGSMSVAEKIQMPDFDPALLPDAVHPGTDLAGDVSVLSKVYGSPFTADTHAAIPQHANDTQPVLIMTETGDITGKVQFAGTFPKPARIVAGRDVVNFHLANQNLSASDTTAVIAGRDIVFDEVRGPSGALDRNFLGIEVAGPGELVVSAGRNITLGNSQGIVTRGNLGNPALPETGASISITVGAQATLDTASFAKQWLDPAKPANYLAQLTEFLKTEIGAAGLAGNQASAAFAALPNADQVRFARSILRLEFAKAYLQPVGAPGVKKSYRDEWLKFVAAEGGDPNAPSAQLFDSFASSVLWGELKGTGRDALPDGATPGVYTRGYDVLRLLGYAAPFSYNGNLSLFLSQIKTQRGGGIDIVAPGGLVNGGATNLPAGFAKGSGDLGIITERGGSIRVMVRNDFLVNQSRVFTLGGGDILIWSSAGNIDAGRGSRTAISAPPPVIRLDPTSGTFIVEYPGAAQGSGIGVLLTQPGAIPGDVDLIAPVGEVNAGDAGIRSAGRISIAAQRVIGADVIQAGGGVSGVPALAPPAPPVPPPPSTADKGTSSSDEASRALAGNAEKQKGASSVLTVEVLSVGGEDEDDEEKKRKRRAQ